MKPSLLGLITTAALSFSALAEPLLTEAFSYPEGPLVSGAAGAWISHSGTADQVDVVAGALQLTEAEGEDVSVRLPGEAYTAAGGTPLFARFTFTLVGLPAGTGGYFAHFRDLGNGFRGRVFVSSVGAAPGAYRLGVGYAGNAANYFPTDLATNTPYTALLKLDLAAGTAALWLEPTAEADPSVVSSDAGSAIAVSTFAFRQSTSSGNGMGRLQVDDLKVATTFAEALDRSLPPPTAPTISVPPASVTVVAGGSVTLTVGVTGSGPLTLAWEKETAPGLWEVIPGANSAALMLPNVQLSDATQYRVRVTYAQGFVLSEPATLTVQADPGTPVSPIVELRARLDPATLTPTNTVQLYGVEGVVTTHVNLTGAANSFFYLQDATAGIAVFVSGGAGVVPPAGARVRVVGPLGHFGGLLQLNLRATEPAHRVEVLSTGNELPAAVPLDYAWPRVPAPVGDAGVVSAEANEGRLVIVTNVLLDVTVPTFSSGSNVTLTDAAEASRTFTLRVDARVLELIGQPKPVGPTTIIGVLSQFTTGPAFTGGGGYQLLPSRRADVFASGPPTPIHATAELTPTHLNLTWTGPLGATYSVWRRVTAAGPFEPLATDLTTPAFTEALADRPQAFYQITSP
jgi:hypothetical protein